MGNLPDKNVKVMVMKMLTKLGRGWMNTAELQQRINMRKYHTNHRAAEYKN